MADLSSVVADSEAYYGRGIIIGMTSDDKLFVAYFITGRSPSSKARKLNKEGGENLIYTVPTDEKLLKTGNPELLIYNAMAWMPEPVHARGYSHARIIAVSNGKQTDSVFTGALTTTRTLTDTTGQWNYEPDAPNYTPRISGRMFIPGIEGKPSNFAELGIIRKAKADESAERENFWPALSKGYADMLTTYTGLNADPLPSFMGNPRRIEIASGKIGGLVEELEPRMGNPEFRVALATMIITKGGSYVSEVRNYSDRK